RLALGFSSGTFDTNTQSYLVRGTQAHVWPQIYFGGYGWMNFEPTASFNKFSRAISTGNGPTPTPSGGAGGATPSPDNGQDLPGHREPQGGGVIGAQGVGGALVNVGLALSLLLALALLCLALFMVWWRIVFRGLSPVSAAFARVSRLGA